MSGMSEQLVSRAEAAKLLGKSKSWLQWMAREGRGPPYQVIAGRYLYDAAALLAWVTEGAQARVDAVRDGLGLG